MWAILEELRALFGEKGETAVSSPSAASTPDFANAICFIVDDEPAVCQFLSAAATASAALPESFPSIKRLSAGLSKHVPGLVFLDIALDGSDAIDGIRLLAKSKFPGLVQLISGADRSCSTMCGASASNIRFACCRRCRNRSIPPR